jgi:hypothetical protein
MSASVTEGGSLYHRDADSRSLRCTDGAGHHDVQIGTERFCHPVGDREPAGSQPVHDRSAVADRSKTSGHRDAERLSGVVTVCEEPVGGRTQVVGSSATLIQPGSRRSNSP